MCILIKKLHAFDNDLLFYGVYEINEKMEMFCEREVTLEKIR